MPKKVIYGITCNTENADLVAAARHETLYRNQQAYFLQTGDDRQTLVLLPIIDAAAWVRQREIDEGDVHDPSLLALLAARSYGHWWCGQ